MVREVSSCRLWRQNTSLERGFVFLSGLGAAQAAQKNKTSLLMSHFCGEAAGKLHEVLSL
jgi:hypothetical protein